MAQPLTELQKDLLIDLYASYKLSDLDNQPAAITLLFSGVPGIQSFCDIEAVIPQYKEYTVQLRAVKNSIEQIATFPTAEAQARYCLIHLNNIQDDVLKTDIFNKMVSRFFIDKLWKSNPAVTQKYLQISEIIQRWNHFFLSYTTRDTPAVNNLYDPELFSQFPPEIVRKELVGNNLIAKYIVRCLKKYNNLKVFFDRDSIVCGDIIADEVYEYCEKTFAFIQLIEDISFSQESGTINWCYNEYERFESNNPDHKKTKYFFLIDGLDINLEAVPSSYSSWAKDIIDSKFEKIFKPFDVISIKRKCQEFTVMVKQARENYIRDLIKTVV